MLTPVSVTGKLFRQYLLMPDHPAKIRLQNAIGRKCFTGGVTLRSRDGIIFNLDANDWITRTILLEGIYEPESLELAGRILSGGGVFIDVGANFGLYTCILSENAAVKVISIEPNFWVIPRLLKNIQLNQRQNVKVLNTALESGVSFCAIQQIRENNMGTASYVSSHSAPYGILSCSLDYIFESQEIKSAKLIKLDIEGNEFRVLENFSFESFFVENILLEFNSLSSQSLQMLCAFFSSKGFLMKNIHGQKIEGDCSDLPENNLWLINQNDNVS